MIISFQRNFAFIKTIKTASTSVEIALSTLCGPADVITYLPPEDEILRRSVSGRSEQNNSARLVERWHGLFSGKSRHDRRRRYHHNTPAADLLAELGEDRWRSLRTATIIRNPYDRAISKYYHDYRHSLVAGSGDPAQHGAEHPADLINHYLLSLGDRDLTNWHLYADGQNVMVTHLLRYEHLAEDLQLFAAALGQKETIELVRAKGTWRGDRRPYQTIIGTELRARIEDAAANELAYGRYDWKPQLS